MICSTLIEQKATASIETGLILGLKGPCQNQDNVNKQTSIFFMVVQCQHVVGKRFSIQNNHVSMDENRKKSGFYPDQPIIDLSDPIKLAKFRLFIYWKMEHKINKIRRNVYTSRKPEI